MPCYKASQWMPDAIKSVQSQTLKNWEMIIVSDASPDDAELAQEAAAKDTRIRVIESPAQQGVSGAKNTALKTARGQYFINIDADNRFPANALEVLANALDKDRSIHISYGAIKFINPNGKPDTKISADGISKWPFDFDFDGQMKYGHNQIQSSAMYRRELFERTGGYRTRFKTAEDADYWTRAVSIGFVPKKVTSAVTLIYINRADSVSRTNKEADWKEWYQ